MLLYYLAALFKGLHPRVDDDFLDKLNYHYTSAIIFAFAIIVSAKQYVGYPIQCWVPAQFTDAWEQYAENYCWIKNTYFLPMHDPIPEEYRDRDARQVGYYQWVPFVLAIQALMFYIPCILWRGLLHWFQGMSVQGISQMACDARMMEHESRSVTVQIIAAHLEDALEMSRSQHSNKDEMSNMMCYRRGCASFVTSLYVVIKCLYFLNVLGNMVILDSFLGTHNLFFGFFILRDIVRGSEWFDTGYFPRVTLCDFEVRVLGNVHHHTIQCVLMINLFNEKIFLFLWFWFFFIAIMTALSLVHWAFISYLPSQREAFVKRYLRATDIVTDRASIKKFIGKFLGYDGVFAIRMVSAHAGDIMTTELIGALWNDFTNRSHRYGADQHEVTDMSSVQVPPQQKRQSTWSSGAAKKGYVGGGGGPSRAKGKRRKGSESFSFV